jgi:hypothetical protein
MCYRIDSGYWFAALFNNTVGFYVCIASNVVVNSNAIPLQARRNPEDSRSLRLPDFKTFGSGKIVSSTHRTPLLPENIPVLIYFSENLCPTQLNAKFHQLIDNHNDVVSCPAVYDSV